MPRKKIKQFNIIRDTREQNGWNFTRSECIVDIIDTKLDTGDYSVEGYEKYFAIERKFSTAEVAQNVLEPRFKNVLERLADMEKKFIICEFSLDNVLEYPINSGIPAKLLKNIRLTPQFLLSCLCQMQVYYNIPVIFAGNKYAAERIAEGLMKRIIE